MTENTGLLLLFQDHCNWASVPITLENLCLIRSLITSLLNLVDTFKSLFYLASLYLKLSIILSFEGKNVNFPPGFHVIFYSSLAVVLPVWLFLVLCAYV